MTRIPWLFVLSFASAKRLMFRARLEALPALLFWALLPALPPMLPIF
jgi:hypothetical protein